LSAETAGNEVVKFIVFTGGDKTFPAASPPTAACVPLGLQLCREKKTAAVRVKRERVLKEDCILFILNVRNFLSFF
jgi:hypothetical protein